MPPLKLHQLQICGCQRCQFIFQIKLLSPAERSLVRSFLAWPRILIDRHGVINIISVMKNLPRLFIRLRFVLPTNTLREFANLFLSPVAESPLLILSKKNYKMKICPKTRLKRVGLHWEQSVLKIELHPTHGLTVLLSRWMNLFEKHVLKQPLCNL